MNTIYNELYRSLKPHVTHCVWVLSDLQQSDPVNARKCMETAMTDYHLLGAPADRVWYLGDSIESSDLDHLQQMAKMQQEAFLSLNVPFTYVLGNHDFEYMRRFSEPVSPFYDLVKATPGWHTTKNLTDLYFTEKLGDFTVFFLSDHAAKDGSWCTGNGRIFGDASAYPYTQKDADALRKKIAAVPGPVITASHYAFPGGNRTFDAEIIGKLLPLPANVRLHLHGHAHIGDYKWAKQDAFRRIANVDWHDIPQVDVSSLENIRSRFCRSILLHVYDNNTFGIFFRDHDHHRFTEAYFPAAENYPRYEG